MTIIKYMKDASRLNFLVPSFRPLFDQSLDNIAVYDTQAQIVYYNPMFLDALNDKKDITSSLAVLKQHASFTSYIKALDNTIVTGESCSILLSLQLPELNRVIHDFIHFSAIKNDEGDVIGVLAVGRDLDFYQQQQNEEVKRREYYLRALLDTFPFMVWMKDKESRFLACNDAFAKVAREPSVHNLEGKTDHDYFEAHAATSYIGGDQEVMRTGLCKTTVEPIVESDGETHWAETFKSRVVVNGEVIGTVGFARDVTKEQEQHQEIKEREYYLRALLDTFPFMVWMKDKESRFLACNDAFAKVAGQPSVHDLEGKTDYDCFPQHAAGYIEDDQEVMQTGLSKTVVEPIKRSNGVMHWAETFKSPVVVNKEVIGTVGFARDITQEQYLQAQVTKRQQDYMTLVNNLPITIVRYDLACKRIFVSAHCDEQYGVSDKVYLFKTPEEEWSPYILNLTGKEFAARLKKVMHTQEEQSFEIHTRHGATFSVNQIKLIPEYDENYNVTGALTIATDVTENAEYRQTIEHLAFHDVLTDLPNRRFFNQTLNKAIARAELNHTAFAVLIMDLDHFKTINDTMGHAVGDRLLIGVANRIKQNVDENYFFARMGGDEFAILIHGYESAEELIAKSSGLLKQIVQPYEIDGAGYFVSASIGVASYPKDSRDVDDLSNMQIRPCIRPSKRVEITINCTLQH
jgi:diguanylate cyclase (GGDEF)-like protein/PAS domain S-box-containing protein